MPSFTFDLLADKALYCHETQYVYAADLHLGKAGHFRRAGVPLPGGHNEHDLSRLSQIIRGYQPGLKGIIFLGDVFHSSHNSEWELFCDWRRHHECSMMLVEGNHDILQPDDYSRAALDVVPEGTVLDKLELRHHPKPGYAEKNTEKPAAHVETLAQDVGSGSIRLGVRTPEDAPLYLCGHLHPGVAIYGNGRQREQLPCFWQRGRMLMLPAFGSFTGLYPITAAQGDGVWGIAHPEVVALHQ